MKLFFFILFIAPCISRTYCAFEGDGVDDLPYLAKNYANKVASDKSTYVLWVELFGNRSELEEYPSEKIEVWAEDLEYGKPWRDIKEPNVAYTQKFVNKQSKPMQVEFTRKIEIKSTFSWSSSSKLNTGFNLKTKVSVPAVLDVTTSITTGMEVSSGKAEMKDETEAYEAKNTLEIPPKKRVTAQLIVTKKNVKVPYKAKIHITGYFAYWTNNQIQLDGYDAPHYLHFRRIDALANSKFVADGKGGLIYTAEGVFRGIKGYETDLKVTEEDIRRNGGKRDAEVTHYKPQLRKLN